MPRLTALKRIFVEHRGRLTLTYSLFALEMLGNLLRPYFLGEAVNDLIAGSYRGLIYLALVHFGYLGVGTLRHMVDTRTYTAIYTKLVTRMLTRDMEERDISRLSAHSTLAREFIDFLEFDLNFIIEAFYNLVGALVLLFFYDKIVVSVCLVVLVPVAFISYRYGKRMQRLTRFKNDELELQVDVISTGDLPEITRHYKLLSKWQIRISDQEAWNFGVMELLVLVVITTSLILITHGTGKVMKAGDIIGIYTYILKFVSGLDTIPYTVQRYSSLKDISGRIEGEAEDF
ncbi:MAG TPA: ABC transporter six-transmembrane domain-containing protein [Dinghuibacter sp.]|uniref:ABC transporter six-transmembrane domain-containing protein n=1 Tax=Dinghuibacter sp. TaxID=2024697 RepID=UPI002CEF5AA1|nr:ABC transporter six-transmembrane domain-containing protein [Dinghuibacter sp.]HTJ14307.1 ABC transporter six-transmembrane domain-containing protein [Dinghuibacter sp.]